MTTRVAAGPSNSDPGARSITTMSGSRARPRRGAAGTAIGPPGRDAAVVQALDADLDTPRAIRTLEREART